MSITTPAAGGPRGPAGADTGAPAATGTATVSGAVTGTLVTYPVPVSTVSKFDVDFAVSADNGTGDCYGREIGVRRGASGAATIISGGAAGVLTAEDNAAATVTFSVDGSGNLLVQFLGASGRVHTGKASLYLKVRVP